jgi:hypothetical protein
MALSCPAFGQMYPNRPSAHFSGRKMKVQEYTAPLKAGGKLLLSNFRHPAFSTALYGDALSEVAPSPVAVIPMQGRGSFPTSACTMSPKGSLLKNSTNSYIVEAQK